MRGREEREWKTGERLGAGRRITIWPPRIHYEQNYEVITALVAKMRRLYTNANECGVFLVFNDASFCPRKERERERGKVNFVIVGTEDSNATKGTFALQVRSGLFSMLTSFLLKIRSPVKIEWLENRTDWKMSNVDKWREDDIMAVDMKRRGATPKNLSRANI